MNSSSGSEGWPLTNVEFYLIKAKEIRIILNCAKKNNTFCNNQTKIQLNVINTFKMYYFKFKMFLENIAKVQKI